jgi:prolyl oligopeptidase
MLRKLAALLLPIAFVACSVPAPQTTPKAVESLAKPPVTETRPVTETLNGVTLTDPYRWLEDQNSPETRAWIDRENAYTDQILDNRPERAQLANRLQQLLSADEMSLPTVRNGRYFFTLRKAGEDVFNIYMRERADGPNILLIDAAPLSPKHTTNIGIEDVSEDGKMLAYYVRHGGADEVEVHFFDVDARHDTATPLTAARYFGTQFGPRGTIYFARYEAEGPRVYRRALAGGAEEKLFGDGYGREIIIGPSVSDDGKYLLVHVSHGSSGDETDIFFKDLTTDGPFKTVIDGVKARSEADFAGDDLIIHTNLGAPNGRMMIVSTANPEQANWRELVPENKDAAIQSFSPAGGKIFVRSLENVRPRIVAYRVDGTRDEEIHFDTLGNLTDIAGTWHTPVAFFRFSSFALPPTIYSYDVAAKQRSVFQRPSVPVNPDDFTVEQIFATSKDGTKVPAFVFYKKGLQRNGKNPTYLTGYGGFAISSLPNFSARAVTLAENGFVYVLANMRGGAEYGEAWHQAGMREKKQNVFEDFYAVAHYLIDHGYTSPQHLGIGGTSNGGLLVTAALTQHPELFKAVFVGYPLVDMLRFDQFLVGSFWVPEYGTAKDPQAFQWIYAYSPYQHVVPGTKYPATLFVTGDADTRVAPLHARKMAALMQASTGSSNPVLIRYHTEGGHSGGEPLSIQVRNESEIEAFLMWQLK